jgi:hypothetical protein
VWDERWHTKRRPVDLATALDEGIDGDALGRARWLLRILRVWADVVGEPNARDHRPSRFVLKDGVLHVASRSAMHAASLQPYLEDVRTKLNRALGKTVVKEIRTKQSSAF